MKIVKDKFWGRNIFMEELLKKEIIKEAKRIEECCEYSSKSHYNTSKT